MKGKQVRCCLFLCCVLVLPYLQAATLFDIEFGSHPDDVLEKYPQGKKVFQSIKIKLSENQKVVAKSTKFNRIYKITYLARNLSCNVIIDRLLVKFPPNDIRLKNHSDVLSQKFWDWKSGDNYTVGFSTCGDHKFQVHVTNSTEKHIEIMQARKLEEKQKRNSIKNAEIVEL